jgi:branched-chain amino acid transport system permease protein
MRKLKLHPCGKFNEQYEEELTIFSTDFGRLWMWVGLFILFAVIPFICSHYHLYVINHIGMAAIAAIGLNILIGYTGQISLGHGAFFGVGAYAAAILATRVGFPFWLSVISAGVITALVGVVFGIPSVRLKHLYLTIATLAGQFILQHLFVSWESLTKGPEGIMLPRASLFGLDVKGDRAFYYVIFVCFVILMLTSYGPDSAVPLSLSVIMTGLRRAWAFPFSNINFSLLPSVPSMPGLREAWRPTTLAASPLSPIRYPSLSNT